MDNNTLDCPVDFVTINENKARLVAFWVMLLAIAYVLTYNWLIVVFLLIDFLLRAFNLNSYSLLGIISGAAIKLLKINHKPVDRAPKRFAAGVGLVFSTAILIAQLSGISIAAIALTAILIKL